MCNFLFLNKKSLKNAENSDDIEVKVSGVFEIKDGQRTLRVTEVDGYPVEEAYEEEACSSCGDPSHEEMMNMDSEDALMLFIQKPKKLNKG